MGGARSFTTDSAEVARLVAQELVRVGQLPLALELELRDLRLEFAVALREAAAGNFQREEQLRSLAAALGRILAREARRGPAERGMPMRELSIAVDRYFPELREWTIQAALQARLARNTPKAS